MSTQTLILNDGVAVDVTNRKLLCSRSDMVRLFSQHGIVNFADHNCDGQEDAGVVDDCIERASEELLGFLSPFYDIEGEAFQSSNLIRHWTAVMATVYLTERRGNSVPESLYADYNRVVDEGGWFDRIRRKTFHLPCVPRRNTSVPIFSNMTVDRRYFREKVRTTRRNSSPIRSKLEQDGAPDFGFGAETE